MSVLKVKTWKDVLWHFLIICGVATVLILILFKLYMPSITNHGEEIEIPITEHLSVHDAIEKLHAVNLGDTIVDTVYSPKHKPGTIVRTFPLAGEKVKEGRRIRLTINQMKLPMVTLPDSNSTKKIRRGNPDNICRTLISLGLRVKKESVNYKRENFVVEIMFGKDTLQAGDVLPINSEVRVLIGNGIADSDIEEELEDSAAFYDMEEEVDLSDE